LGIEVNMAANYGISTAALRSQLMGLINFTGTHKDQADKYRQLLKTVLTNTGQELIER